MLLLKILATTVTRASSNDSCMITEFHNTKYCGYFYCRFWNNTVIDFFADFFIEMNKTLINATNGLFDFLVSLLQTFCGYAWKLTELLQFLRVSYSRGRFERRRTHFWRFTSTHRRTSHWQRPGGEGGRGWRCGYNETRERKPYCKQQRNLQQTYNETYNKLIHLL